MKQTPHPSYLLLQVEQHLPIRPQDCIEPRAERLQVDALLVGVRILQADQWGAEEEKQR